MRKFIDRIFRASIKLAMLTGVAFTMAACYGPPPEQRWQDEPDFEEEQSQVEACLTQERS